MLELTACTRLSERREATIKVISCRGYYRLRALTATHPVCRAAALFMTENDEACCSIVVLECLAAFGIAAFGNVFVGPPTA